MVCPLFFYVLCHSYGLLIGMYYVLSSGLRHLPNICRPYGAGQRKTP